MPEPVSAIIAVVRRILLDAVKQNGQQNGIPPEMIRTIFEPFVTTKGERGTGLGLWIVKGIIQNHAGKLSVRSKVGRGTIFKIDLPVVKL